MSFRLEKTYVDVVTDDGSVAVFYLSRAAGRGLRWPYHAMEWYPADGPVQAHHARDAQSELLPDGHLRYRFNVGGSAVTVDAEPLESGLPRWPDSRSTISGRIAPFEWSVVSPRTRVRCLKDGAPWIDGHGYIDHVRLYRTPRRLGIRTMRWGRIHLAAGTVVFNELELEDGRSLATLTRWPDGVTDPAPKLHEDGTVLTISGAGADWKLMPERVLHRGTIPDRTRFSRGVDRLVTRLVAGPMHETRLLSRIVDPEGIAGGWALHETVHFGREGRA